MKQPAVALLCLLTMLGACSEETQQSAIPAPIALTDEAAGHYCQMAILEHPGPKAQLFVETLLHPLWFSQVRDGLAKIKSAERSADIIVLYVNDMGAAKSWEEPGTENWIRVEKAYFVVGSNAMGGMGAPEYVPFSDKAKAMDFITNHGGSIMRFEDITAEEVLSPIDVALPVSSPAEKG